MHRCETRAQREMGRFGKVRTLFSLNLVLVPLHFSDPFSGCPSAPLDPPPTHTPLSYLLPTYHPPIGDSHVSQILTLSPMLLIYLPTASWVFHGIPTFHAISGTVCSPRHRFTSTLPSSIGLFLFQPSVTFKKSARQQIFDTEPVVYMIFTFQSFKKYHLLS